MSTTPLEFGFRTFLWLELNWAAQVGAPRLFIIRVAILRLHTGAWPATGPIKKHSNLVPCLRKGGKSHERARLNNELNASGTLFFGHCSPANLLLWSKKLADRISFVGVLTWDGKTLRYYDEKIVILSLA